MRKQLFTPSVFLLLTALSLWAIPVLGAPMSGNYDIGGGNNNFPAITAAIDSLTANGMDGSVTFNVYPGVYNGQVSITPAIPGSSVVGAIVFQAVSGMAAPQVINTIGSTSADGNGFLVLGVDYVTIRGFEIYNCAFSGININETAGDTCFYVTVERNYIHNYGVGQTTAAVAGIYANNAKFVSIQQNSIQTEYHGDYSSGIAFNYCYYSQITNNMVYGDNPATGPATFGLRLHQGAQIEIYYNSIYMSSVSGNASIGVFLDYVTSAAFKNNIVANIGYFNTTKFAIYQTGELGSYPIVSDYNDLYAPGNTVGYYNTVICPTLLSWQTATGQDNYSISYDPTFLCQSPPFYLHINTTVPSPVDNIGTAITTVLYDIDGDLRNPVFPDMGADEFSFVPQGPLAGSYDIGGGDMDFISIRAAMNILDLSGMNAPVTFNVYNGTYLGLAAITDSIAGLGAANPLVIQAAPGQTPFCQSLPYDYYCFSISEADYVTIRGFTIDGYSYGIFVTGVYADSCSNIVIEDNTFQYNPGYAANGGLFMQYTKDSQARGNTFNGYAVGLYIDNSSEVLAYNNMLYGQNSYCIVASYLKNCGFYYNSAQCAVYTIYFSYCDSTVEVKNNSFKHTGQSGCAILTAVGTEGIFTSDYNNIWSRYNLIASYQGASCPYLYEWQTYTGQDAHSVSANPRYLSNTDLHIVPTVLSWNSDTATPIAGITTDFDGDTRDALTPDMGCDEYAINPPAPMSGTYDIGGGDNDFTNIIGALDTLNMTGMGGPVTFNVYTGTYPATNYITKWIPGLGAANPLTIQNAPGETPGVIWWEWGEIQAFDIYCADYVTIKGIAMDVLGTNITIRGNPVDYCEHVTLENCVIPGNALPFVTNGIVAVYVRDFKILGNQIWNVPRGLTIQYADSGLVANNRFSSNNYFTLYGMNVTECTNTEFYYNSFFMGGYYCAALQAVDSTLVFKNNILDQINQAYCLHRYGPVITDYNCFYNYYSAYVYTGIAYYSLLEWQTASGQDIHSVTGDPMFTADMHINPYVISPVSEMGIPVASVTIDMEYDIRSLTTPDIGADEYVFIGQYGVLLTPEDTTGTDTTGNTIYYPFYVKNTGTMTDTYTLTITGTEWTAAVYNAPGGGVINAVSLDMEDSICVYLGHSVPDGIPEQFQDDGLLIAVSQSNSAAADTSTFLTHAIIWPPVQGEIELDQTDITIPAQGGSFSFQYTVTNYDQNNPYLIRIWKSVDMPNGQNANLWGCTFTIPAGDIRSRHITQLVPAAAPPGTYLYHLKIIHMVTWEVWDDDMITFVKEAGDGGNSPYTTWDWYGWDTPDMTIVIPTVYDMKPAAPNPFNAETVLKFDLPEAGKALLEIYDVSGRLVSTIADGYFSAGCYDFKFSGADLSSGIYFARLQAGKYVKTQKLVLLK